MHLVKKEEDMKGQEDVEQMLFCGSCCHIAGSSSQRQPSPCLALEAALGRRLLPELGGSCGEQATDRPVP